MTGWQGLQRIDQERPWLLDVALALALLAASLFAVATTNPSSLQMALMVITAAAYAARRVAPLPVLLVASGLVTVMMWLGFSTAVIGTGLFLVSYSVAAHRGKYATTAAAVLVIALVTVLAVAFPHRMPPGEALTNLALFAGALVLGRAARIHRESVRLVAERAALSDQVHREEARTALTEERLRIARELHDVVGHSLGVIALQAAVGARVVDSEPQEAKAALLAIADRSRESLREVRQILGSVRDPESARGSTSGLAAVPHLLAHLSEAGLQVELEQVGTAWPLSPAMDLAVFRVLQESLTNVVRHAESDRAQVRITWSDEALELWVRDHGRGPTNGCVPASGQLGMRERVAMWGGTIQVGAAQGGGYEVVVWLPRRGEQR